MPRTTEHAKVMFPVEEHPVLVHIQSAGGERRVRVPERKAIVNQTTGNVVGIVNRGYRLTCSLYSVTFIAGTELRLPARF